LALTLGQDNWLAFGSSTLAHPMKLWLNFRMKQLVGHLGPQLFIKPWLNFVVLQKHDFCINNIINKILAVCLKSLTMFDFD
jgi:hypothetical protein